MFNIMYKTVIQRWTELNAGNKNCEFSGNSGDGIDVRTITEEDWLQGYQRNNQNSHKGLCLAIPCEGVSLISVVKYLEHQKWKQWRMVR